MPGSAWHFTLGRLWLEVLPSAAVVLGGVLVTVSAGWLAGVAGAVLAALAGGWFAVGDAVNSMWPHLGTAGVPSGSVTQAGLEKTGYFTGLGMVIVFVAALTLGGLLAPQPEPEAAASGSLLVEL